MNRAGSASDVWLALRIAADVEARLRLALALLAAILASGLMSAGPLVLKWLVDGLARSADAFEVYALAAAYVLVLVAGRMLDLAQAFLFATGDQRLQRRMAEVSHAKVLSLPLRAHFDHAPGGILQILNQGQQGLRTWVMHILFSFTPVLVQLPGILVISAGVLSGSIAASLAAGALAYAVVFYLGARRIARTARDISAVQVKTSSRLADELTNIETIKSFGGEQAFVRDFATMQAATETIWRGLHFNRLRNGVAIAAVFALILGFALFQGAAGALDGHLTAGGFVLLGAYVLQLVRPLELAGFAVRDLSQASVYLSGWARLMEEASEACCPEEAGGRKSLRGDVVFSGVSFAYSAGCETLASISFTAKAGSVLAIVGASGAGKTTIGRLLLRHFEPDAGDIRVGGEAIASLSVNAVRTGIAVVSQDTSLLDASLADNIRLGRSDASEADLKQVIQAAGLTHLVERLPDGLEARVGPRGANLSGGERQRVAISRALLRDSDVFLLDEPTSALDAETERALLPDLIDASRGRTTILITHRTGLALHADRVIVLENGRIAEEGAPAELVERDGPFARLCGLQADGMDTRTREREAGTHVFVSGSG